MKKSAIIEILHGLQSDGFIAKPKDAAVNIEEYDLICAELKEKLSPELLSLHQRFLEYVENDWSKEVDSCFAQGFKLGLRLGFECAEE